MKDKKCIELVFSTRPGDFKPRRCNRPAGQGTNGDYCSTHSTDTSKIEPLSARGTKRKVWKGGRT